MHFANAILSWRTCDPSQLAHFLSLRRVGIARISLLGIWDQKPNYSKAVLETRSGKNSPCEYGMLASYSARSERLAIAMYIKTTNIILYCKKWDEMVAFYQTGLKLPITTSTNWFVEFQLTRTSRLSVADESHTSIKSAGGKGITIGLQVADIVAAHSRLQGAGLNPTAVKEVWGAEAFYVFDPEGNRVEIWSGRAKS